VLQDRVVCSQIVQQVLQQPEQSLNVEPGRNAQQSSVELESTLYWVRVIVENETTVMTVDHTRHIENYWEAS
jgi:hypothetical protein